MSTAEYVARLGGLSEAEIREGLALEAERLAAHEAAVTAFHADEMDAPAWDSGVITFDPYVA